mmetsp:Transcript_31443/g.100260  ORF Transcript_31443/g.100260 Transcript_31443/m.100260 type:complete len:215 (+) Transcript_31443:74-718(+)
MSMCRLLLVAAVLCTLQETEADAEVGENPTGLVPPSESPELNTGLSLHFQATTEVVWAIFNVALGYWILSRLESRQHNGVDMAFAWFLVPVHFAEGIAFLMSALNLFKQSPLISTAFLVLQISCHTPFLWARVYYLLRHDEPKEGMLVACRILPFTTLVAVLVIMFPKSLLLRPWPSSSRASSALSPCSHSSWPVGGRTARVQTCRATPGSWQV